ncbi:uncharacterized protein RCO7_06698 [Rhynchosporium graminicola]|uniref:Uncharacterized protein n=1 Tax=Rhynchosporium graminicola TaxID=2792576 RepID=A0A1E1JYE7_9HELO|nr:uncharacterized protein RCO7_06698 [Rhynchosporium commune]
MATMISAPSFSKALMHAPTSAFQQNSSNSKPSVTTSSVKQVTSMTKKDLLVVSPYLEEDHLLDLSTLDTANQLLAKALVDLRFIRDDHRTAPYVDSFNWPEIIDSVHDLAQMSGFNWTKTDLSRIPPTTVYSDLGVLDKAAHAEATASGGFLKYIFSSPDSAGRNLATCVWRSRQDASNGSVGPGHRQAAQATRLLYTEWAIERLRLIIDDDVKSWRIVDWSA